MFKKLIMTAAVLAMFNIGTSLAAEAYDLNKLKADISRIEAGKAKIASLESSLNGLKIDSRANIWNFVGRSGNEKIIQKRSLIVRELSTLRSENFKISRELLQNRDSMYAGFANGLKDEAFRYVLDYLDGLAVADALSLDFMDARDINPADKTRQHVEFLRYKRDMQDFRLKNIARLIRQLKSAVKACQAAKLDDQAQSRDKYIKELGDKQAEGEKSQDAIDKFLK
jgi:hypothetical protein